MAAKTITVKGRGIGKEGVAGGAITPGMLVVLNSSNAVIANNVAGRAAPLNFARENELIGKGIDVAYALGDTVMYETLFPGCEVNTLVAAAAPAIVIGDRLASNGAGGVKKGNGTTDVEIGIALQAVDNSAGGSLARILMEVI